jgi:hypothetical protein
MADEGEPKVSFPRIEVLPPLGTENEPPVLASIIDVSGGNSSPIVLDFYHVSANTYKRIVREEKDYGLERPRADHVIVRQSPVARVGVTPQCAAVVVAALYEQLQKEEHSTVLKMLDAELAKLREQAQQQGE